MDKIEFKKPNHYTINYEEYVVPAINGCPEEIRDSLDIETGIAFTLSDIDSIIKDLERLKCIGGKA